MSCIHYTQHNMSHNIIHVHVHTYTVVWEKFVVENIHMKIICGKKIFVVAGIRRKFFTVKFFSIEFFLIQAGCCFNWTRSCYTLKWKSVKGTLCMCYYRFKGCGNWRRMAWVTECETGKITSQVSSCCEEGRNNRWRFAMKNIWRL